MMPMFNPATTMPPPALAALHTDVARLLADAQSALSRDPDAALRYITKASALLVQPPVPAVEPLRHGSGGLAPWQASRVRNYIEAHLAEPITIQDLAEQTGLSASYFSRAFRASVGEAPYVHVMRRRIEQACVMMLETTDPLSQIAVDCGLADQSHFTRLFRRFLGTTPNAWRRSHREKRPALA